jgi:hypothetical protein
MQQPMPNDMRPFYLEFLNEDLPPGPRVSLGIFGKHPGWDDHFDIGIDTQSLVMLKNLLYTQGIGAEVETQAWQALPDQNRLPGFGHWFIWLRPSEYIIGSLWNSSDGKGRSLYPLVAAAHVAGLPLSWGIRHACPILSQARMMFQTAVTSTRVRAVALDALDSLRNSTGGSQVQYGMAGLVGTPGIANLLSTLAGHRDWLRPLYGRILDTFHVFAPKPANYKETSVICPVQALRVPSFNADPMQNLNAWLGLLYSDIDPATPVLAIMPDNGLWIDLMAGEPVKGSFRMLKAGIASIPFSTDSQNMPPEPPVLDAIVARRTADFIAGDLPVVSLFNNHAPVRNLQNAIVRLDAIRDSGRGFLKRLFSPSVSPGRTTFAGD